MIGDLRYKAPGSRFNHQPLLVRCPRGPREGPRLHSNSILSPGPFQTTKMLPKKDTHWKQFPVVLEVPVSGNLKIMVSYNQNHHFHGWRGSRKTSCAALGAQCFSMWFSQPLFLRFVKDLGSNMGPRGGPTKDPRTTFSATFSTLPPWAAPGKPRVAKRPPRHQTHQNDIKIIPT